MKPELQLATSHIHVIRGFPFNHVLLAVFWVLHLGFIGNTQKKTNKLFILLGFKIFRKQDKRAKNKIQNIIDKIYTQLNKTHIKKNYT